MKTAEIQNIQQQLAEMTQEVTRLSQEDLLLKQQQQQAAATASSGTDVHAQMVAALAAITKSPSEVKKKDTKATLLTTRA